MRWRMLEVLVVVIIISILVIASLMGKLLHLLGRTSSELSWPTLITRSHRNWKARQ